jgi:hypothetical protein
MDVKGFLNRFEACTVNGQRFVNQSDVEFLIDQLGLNKSDKSDVDSNARKIEQEYWVVVNDEGKVLNTDETHCDMDRLTYRDIMIESKSDVKIPFEDVFKINDKQMDDAKQHGKDLNYFTYSDNFRFQRAVSNGKLKKVRVTTTIEF